MKTNVLIVTTAVWIVVAVTAYFVGKSSGKVEPRYIDKIVEVTKTNTVTVLVDKPVEVWKTNLVRVPVEVVKEVPAAIPEDYVTAKLFVDKFRAAKAVDSPGSLAGIDRLALGFILNKSLEGVIAEADLRDDVELALRRNSIRIAPKADQILLISVNALWDESKTVASYSVNMTVHESATFWRKTELVSSWVRTWEDGSFGRFNRATGKKWLKETVADLVVTFSNAYLKANEK